MYPYIHILNRVIPSYGLCIAAAALLAGFLMIRRVRGSRIKAEDILIVMAVTVGCALAGAKILYLLVTYSIPELIEALRRGEYEILTGSGLVFYGGAIAGFAGCYLGCRIAGCRMAELEDTAVPVLPLAHGIGRIGCFLAGCCYGMPYEGPLAVHYPHHLFGFSPDQGCFPVQPLEAFLNILLCLWLYIESRKPHRPYFLFFRYIMMYAVLRFLLEFLRGDVMRGSYWEFSTSQWISAALFLVTLFLSVIMKNLHKPALQGKK